MSVIRLELLPVLLLVLLDSDIYHPCTMRTLLTKVVPYEQVSQKMVYFYVALSVDTAVDIYPKHQEIHWQNKHPLKSTKNRTYTYYAPLSGSDTSHF